MKTWRPADWAAVAIRSGKVPPPAIIPSVLEAAATRSGRVVSLDQAGFAPDQAALARLLDEGEDFGDNRVVAIAHARLADAGRENALVLE